MQADRYKSRIEFAVQLLYDLKKASQEASEIVLSIEKCSSGFFQRLYQESKNEVQEDIEKYKHNLQKIKQLNLDITSGINEWYEFIKNPGQLKKLYFPVLFHIRRRKLNQLIKKTNENISQIAIENRFIMERMCNWEHQLELKAIQLIKDEMDFKYFESLALKKDELISELKYLLPSIPHLCPVDIDLVNIDLLIEKVQKTPAA